MWKSKNADKPVHQALQCGLLPRQVIYLEPEVKAKIELLMDAYPHQEWMSYMAGREEAGNFFVIDLIIPPHVSAGGGNAEAEPFHQPEGCLGVMHSHHTMGAFHSGTDDAFVDRNYPISVTVARKTGQTLEFACVSYAMTPCGQATMSKPDIRYVQPDPQFDTKTWLEEAKANIDKANKRRVREVESNSFFIDRAGNQVPYSDFQDKELDRPYIPIRFRSFDDERKAPEARLKKEAEKGWGKVGEVFTDDKGVVQCPKELASLQTQGAEEQTLSEPGESEGEATA